MQAQEVVTIISKIPHESTGMQDSFIKSYPELASLFGRGMYVETFSQTMITPERYMITFIFRHYNTYQQTGAQPA